jgi:hypothetical protein
MHAYDCICLYMFLYVDIYEPELICQHFTHSGCANLELNPACHEPDKMTNPWVTFPSWAS